jgi:hypothetical protein
MRNFCALLHELGKPCVAVAARRLSFKPVLCWRALWTESELILLS